jgi:CheY-like chemotaxis protein
MKFVALPRFGSAGEFVDFVGSAFDVTDLKQAEEVLKEADRSKNRFLALLSHELRTPLAPLRDVVHLLRDQNEDPEKLQWTWGMIDRQVQTIARMIDDLLDVSRITQGKILLKREVIEVREVVERAVETARALLDVRKQELRLEAPTSPLYVHGDPVRLQQVVGNLLNNASKFTPDRGHVSVAIAAVDEPAEQGPRKLVEIRVRDDGLGIEPDARPHIFEPFYQADRTIERTQGGLGIGLALVRSLVEQHGGTVQAYSEGTGRGCEVVVRLPAHPGQPATTAHTPPTVTTQTSARQDPVLHRILVVDDHVDAGETMTMLLRAAGHDVRLVHRGPDALEEAGRFHPSVVLLDIGLPGMDGYEVARRMRQQFAQDPVLLVAISGYGQDEHRREAREAGFDHFFTKPVSIKVLREFLANPTSRGE